MASVRNSVGNAKGVAEVACRNVLPLHFYNHLYFDIISCYISALIRVCWNPLNTICTAYHLAPVMSEWVFRVAYHSWLVSAGMYHCASKCSTAAHNNCNFYREHLHPPKKFQFSNHFVMWKKFLLDWSRSPPDLDVTADSRIDACDSVMADGL